MDLEIYKLLVENTPLPSVDLCIVVDESLLMGRRCNAPLKGRWFTPGSCLRKNESISNGIERVARVELGLSLSADDCKPFGSWDHFYSESVFGSCLSTHYVNLPHYIELKSTPKIFGDDQHSEFHWFSLKEVVDDISHHKYMREYAAALSRLVNNDRRL